MDTLHLVTHRSSFFENRIGSLRERGVGCNVVHVPGREHEDREERTAATRSVRHYLSFYADVLTASPRSYDLVHAHYGLTGPFALAQPCRPVVLTLWGSDLMGEYGWLSERCARFVDEIVVMSQEMADQLPVDATVIPHGVDIDRFRPIDQREAQRRVGWDPGRAHVIFPYSPSRDVKNYPLAERVVERTRDAAERDVELHAVFDVEHEEVPTYMNAADALLLTSRREGSPNTLKEALACNLPVVATDVGDARERLDGVEPSSVCTSESALVDALVGVLDRDERSNGRGVAEELSLGHTAERLEEVYQRALEN